MEPINSLIEVRRHINAFFLNNEFVFHIHQVKDNHTSSVLSSEERGTCCSLLLLTSLSTALRVRCALRN